MQKGGIVCKQVQNLETTHTGMLCLRCTRSVIVRVNSIFLKLKQHV